MSADRIAEMDWGDSLALKGGAVLHAETAHHFSGRSLRRDPSLWLSYVLESPSLTVYAGGDSGYGPHFADIGARFGGIDLAILENGQYDENWRYNHLFPEEVYRAFGDLGAGRLLPVHSAKFRLSNHPWDEPLRRISGLFRPDDVRLVTPVIGEIVDLSDENRIFERWWERIR